MKDVWRSRSIPSRLSCQGQVELLASTYCSAGCVERSHKNLPVLKLRVFVDDITCLVKGRNKDVAEVAKKVMKKLKEEVEKKGLKLSALKRQGRKEQYDSVVWILGE